MIMQLLHEHFEGYSNPDTAFAKIGRFVAELEAMLTEERTVLLNDELRESVGMQPVGPEGWTRAELLAYEAARLALLVRPILQILPDQDVEIIMERPAGFTWNKDPGPEGEKS
jgi:hypothetical protein